MAAGTAAAAALTDRCPPAQAASEAAPGRSPRVGCPALRCAPSAVVEWTLSPPRGGGGGGSYPATDITEANDCLRRHSDFDGLTALQEWQQFVRAFARKCTI